MKITFISKVVVVAVSAFLALGCVKNDEAQNISDETVFEIVGSSDLFESLSYLENISTKSGEVSEEEILDLIQPLFTPAKEYLVVNGYDYTEDFEEDNPNIILTAYALMEYDFIYNQPATKITISDFASCLVLGDAVGEYSATGTALLAKRFAKKFLIRSIPYVGAAVAVVMAGVCLYENW